MSWLFEFYFRVLRWCPVPDPKNDPEMQEYQDCNQHFHANLGYLIVAGAFIGATLDIFVTHLDNYLELQLNKPTHRRNESKIRRTRKALIYLKIFQFGMDGLASNTITTTLVLQLILKIYSGIYIEYHEEFKKDPTKQVEFNTSLFIVLQFFIFSLILFCNTSVRDKIIYGFVQLKYKLEARRGIVQERNYLINKLNWIEKTADSFFIFFKSFMSQNAILLFTKKIELKATLPLEIPIRYLFAVPLSFFRVIINLFYPHYIPLEHHLNSIRPMSPGPRQNLQLALVCLHASPLCAINKVWKIAENKERHFLNKWSLRILFTLLSTIDSIATFSFIFYTYFILSNPRNGELQASIQSELFLLLMVLITFHAGFINISRPTANTISTCNPVLNQTNTDAHTTEQRSLTPSAHLLTNRLGFFSSTAQDEDVPSPVEPSSTSSLSH